MHRFVLRQLFESKAETEKAIACINNAVSYTKRNESKMLFLTSRNYKWSDLKYGLSRRLTHKGNLMLQVPIIKGKLVSADIRERLSGEANRGYVLFVFDHAGRVTTVDYVEQFPLLITGKLTMENCIIAISKEYRTNTTSKENIWDITT